ncbi:hypothetical protein CCH79_00010354 [Gambusia affinis]|uniref:Receptor ligand binding region domain-containing protein n=1 Tax=Gambusia affinis TaxID=33528 RepID=A0A315VRS5_GAMAF|nr:hypothetical protein CCH79_00010354 [Gambusia affinis]
MSLLAQLIALWLVRRQLAQTLTCSRWGTPSDSGLFEDGDVIIGGLFNLHYMPPVREQRFTLEPDNKPCTGLLTLPLQYIYAMVFALEEINHSSALLPGVKLGHRIHDSCALPAWEMQAALSLVGGDAPSCNSGQDETEVGAGGQRVPLIIGGSSSITANVLSRLLGPLSVPLVSYTASSPSLSDRLQFPNFFRTMASDIYQARAIAQLAIKYNWAWVGAVVANNDYGLMAVKVFQEEIQGTGVCLSFLETLQRENIESDTRRAALTIQASTAKVILIFTWFTDVMELFLQLEKLNVTDRQFLASEAWSTSSDLRQSTFSRKVARGVLGVAIRSSPLPGFGTFVRNLNPRLRPNDQFLKEFWEKEFGCSPGIAAAPSSSSLPPCNGTESLWDVENLFTDASQLRVTYNVYLAVYAAAHALHSLLSCPDVSRSPGGNVACSLHTQIKPMEMAAADFKLIRESRQDTQRTKLTPKAACWNRHDHAEGRPMKTSEHRKQSFSDRRSRKLSSELLARTCENTGPDSLPGFRFPNVKHQNVERGHPSAYHRRMAVVKEHREDSCCHRDTGNGHCCEGDAQSFIEGKEIQLARDAGGTLGVGPELRWATIALSGTWTQKRKKQTRTPWKSWQKG